MYYRNFYRWRQFVLTVTCHVPHIIYRLQLCPCLRRNSNKYLSIEMSPEDSAVAGHLLPLCWHFGRPAILTSIFLGKVQRSTDNTWLFSPSTVVVHGLTVAPVFRLHQIENGLLRIRPWRTWSAWSNSCPGMYGHRMAVRIFDSLVSDGR